jgi:hypothetical protein
MTGHLSERMRWAIVMAFAIAMAWVEAARVFYIRALVDRIEPYQADPLPYGEDNMTAQVVEIAPSDRYRTRKGRASCAS